jgi:hypothetical protein
VNFQDLAQNVCVRLIENRLKAVEVEREGKIKAYIFIIAKNEYLAERNESTIDLDSIQVVDELEFDYNIVKPNINPLADGIINEMWPLFRIFWLAMGPYKISVTYDQVRDRAEFGQWRALVDDKSSFDAVYSFEIDANGDWSADFDMTLVSHHSHDIMDSNFTNFGFVFKDTVTGNWTRPPADIIDV